MKFAGVVFLVINSKSKTGIYPANSRRGLKYNLTILVTEYYSGTLIEKLGCIKDFQKRVRSGLHDLREKNKTRNRVL